VPGDRFYEQVIEPLLVNASAAAREGDAEMRDKWMKLRSKRYGDMVGVWEKEREGFKQQAWQALAEMRKAETEIHKRTEAIDAFRMHTEVERGKQAYDEYAEIRRLVAAGACSNIVQEDRNLFFNIPQFMQEHEGKGYVMGPFKVTVDVQLCQMTILAADDSAPRVNGYIHPHITERGDCCVGSAGEHLAKAVASGSVIEIITTILNYVRSYNEKTAYKGGAFTEWKSVDIQKHNAKKFEACFAAVSPKQCVQCRERGCPHKEDAGIRCAEQMKGNPKVCAGCNKCQPGRDLSAGYIEGDVPVEAVPAQAAADEIMGMVAP
jgi:hypothetical protein